MVTPANHSSSSMETQGVILSAIEADEISDGFDLQGSSPQKKTLGGSFLSSHVWWNKYEKMIKNYH